MELFYYSGTNSTVVTSSSSSSSSSVAKNSGDRNSDSDGKRGGGGGGGGGGRGGGVDKVIVHLTTVQDIKAGEELTVSYLSQLCTPVRARAEVLSQAFLFDCSCDRCREEVEERDGEMQTLSEGEGSSVGGEGSEGGDASIVKERKDISEVLPPPPTALTSTALPLPSPSYASYKDAKTDENNINTKLRTLLELTMSHVSAQNDQEASRNDTKEDKNRFSNSEHERTQTDQILQLLILAETFYENIISVRTAQGGVRALSDEVYSIHDSGMLVLRSALSIRKQKSLQMSSSLKGSIEGGQGEGRGLGSDSMQTEGMVVRATRLVTESWTLAGCQVTSYTVRTYVHTYVHTCTHASICPSTLNHIVR